MMSERPTLKDFDPKKIDAIFAPFDQCHSPGAAVGIAIDGAPLYRKGFGRENVELPVLLSPSMRMRIGSTTKHMAALALLMLCEEGRAGIDDAIGKYLPELNEANRHVTLRRLMGHTSGLRDVYQISMFMHGMSATITDAEMLDYYRTIDDVDFAPGESWSYNNGGYLLLTAAMERITGQTLDEVLSRRVFQPVGMYDTQLRRWDSDFLPNSAALHMVDGKGGYRKEGMGMELSGAGGVVSTMDDMLRWLRHMDSPVVGSVETWS
jgi:CubicO group peptidase (beta-lactamase class C family)